MGSSRGSPALPSRLAANRDFRLLWIGEGISELGSAASTVALPLLVLAVSGSPALTGAVAAAIAVGETAPILLFGVWADRYNRRLLMLSANVVRAGTLAVVAVAAATGWASVGLLAAAGLVTGTMTALFAPAENGALNRIVRRDQYGEALARNAGRASAAQLIGSPIGGALFSLGRAVPFAADALSYLVGAGTAAALRTPQRPAGAGRAEPLRRELAEGLRFVWRQRFLRATLLSAAVLNLLINAVFLGAVIIARTHGASPVQVGLLETLSGLGALAGALAAPRLIRTLPLAALVLGGFTIITLAVIPAAFTTNPYALGAVLAAASLTIAPINAGMGGYRMRITPDKLQGRVKAANYLTATSIKPLGIAGVGVLLTHLSPTSAVLTIAAGLALTTISLAAVPAVRTVAAASEEHGRH